MILLAAEGLANVEIGSRLGVPRQVVSKWRRRFVEERLAGLADHPRRGRSRQDPNDSEQAGTKEAALHGRQSGEL
jgi:transposase